jgi:hypothetical protein
VKSRKRRPGPRRGNTRPRWAQFSTRTSRRSPVAPFLTPSGQLGWRKLVDPNRHAAIRGLPISSLNPVVGASVCLDVSGRSLRPVDTLKIWDVYAYVSER